MGLRAERARYGLPPFVTPLDAELRCIRRQHPQNDVRRLALEVQCDRCTISELEATAGESYWHMQKDYATIADARKLLDRLREGS